MAIHKCFKPKENSGPGWSLLTSLDKATRENHELNDEVSWLQIHINSLKVPTYALEKNLLSSGRRAHVTENQMPVLIIQLTGF